jgi:murein hydrolase activator
MCQRTMRNAVNKTICLLFFFLSIQGSWSQTKKKEQLEKERKQIENRINDTKKLLGKTENDLRNRTVELQMIERNLALREQLVRNIDLQIRSTEQRISELENSMKQLSAKTSALKQQFSDMVLYAYKNRGSLNKLMFVFSSDNFNQAMKRAVYLEKINEVRTRQVQLIRSNQEQLLVEQKELEKARNKAIELAESKKSERETLLAKPIETKPVTKPEELGLTPEAKVVGNNFAANKGRLPYPVNVGTVVERFGRNAHPTISNVYTDNNGIDISTNRGAEVRAVFEGEVSSVITIPGAGKAVIISHGNYRTVYANMQDVYVTKGAKVSHKHLLGSLLPQGNISILHFEIHVINGNTPQKLNPELWLSK